MWGATPHRVDVQVRPPTLSFGSIVVRLCSSLLVTVGLLLGVSRAEADERVDVRWSAPRDCPSSAELTRRTASRVPEGQHVRAVGRVTKTGAKYKLQLEIESTRAGDALVSKGERSLEAEACDALATSAAVVIAMSVAPARDEPEAAPEPAPAPATAAPAPPPEAAEAREPAIVVPARAETKKNGVTLRPEAVLDGGTLPSVGFGGGAAIGYDLGRLHLEARGALFGAVDGTAPSDGGKGASFSLLSGGARVCWAFVASPIEASACGGVGIAHLGATGFGARAVRDGDATLVGPELGGSLVVPIAGAVRIRAGVFGFAPISRRSFVITALGAVHEPAAVAIGASVGPEVRF